jgi:hypothetical protein
MRTWYDGRSARWCGICKVEGAKAGVCWVARGKEWPLNIVFRAGCSEKNTVAWRAVEERGTVERATLAPVLLMSARSSHATFFDFPSEAPHRETCGVTCHMYPFNVPYPCHGHLQFVSCDPRGWPQTLLRRQSAFYPLSLMKTLKLFLT